MQTYSEVQTSETTHENASKYFSNIIHFYNVKDKKYR